MIPILLNLWTFILWSSMWFVLHVHLKRMCSLLLLEKCPINVNYFQFFWWIKYSIPLLIFYLLRQLLRIIAISHSNHTFVYFSSLLYQFLFHIFWNSVVCTLLRLRYLFEEWTLYCCKMNLFFPGNFFCIEAYFGICIITPGFL